MFYKFILSIFLAAFISACTTTPKDTADFVVHFPVTVGEIKVLSKAAAHANIHTACAITLLAPFCPGVGY